MSRRFILVVHVLMAAAAAVGRSEAGLVADGLVLDLEARRGVTVDGSGRVSLWTDFSGEGHHAFQAVAGRRPTFVPAGAEGGPALLFDGADDFLDVVGQVLTSQQYTIMALVTDNGGTGWFREVFSNWAFDNMISSVFLGTGYDSPIGARITDEVGGATDPNHPQKTVGEIVSPRTPFVLTGVSGADDVSVLQGHSLLGAKGSIASTRNLSTGYVIGKQGQLEDEFWNGRISAVLVYDRALTAEERARNLEYLGSLSAVPEPSTVVGAALGSLVLGGRALRRRRARPAFKRPGRRPGRSPGNRRAGTAA